MELRIVTNSSNAGQMLYASILHPFCIKSAERWPYGGENLLNKLPGLVYHRPGSFVHGTDSEQAFRFSLAHAVGIDLLWIAQFVQELMLVLMGALHRTQQVRPVVLRVVGAQYSLVNFLSLQWWLISSWLNWLITVARNPSGKSQHIP